MNKINYLIYLIVYSILFFLKSFRDFYFEIKSKILYFNYCNINILRNRNFKKFLKKNSELTKESFNDKIDENNGKYLLLDLFIFHPAYIANQFILANFLKKILNLDIKILLLSNNSLIQKLGKSYGINNFIKLKKPNYFKSYIGFLKIFNYLIKINDLNEFKKLQSNNVKLGEISYDHYVRFTGDLDVKKINFKLIYFYFKAYCYDLSIKQILTDKKCSGLILSETQFIPSAIVFQNTLEKKLNVYARYGGPKYIGIRIYNDIDEVYYWKQKINLDDFNKIKQNFKNEAEKDGYKIIYNRINLIKNKQDLNDTDIAYKKKISLSKNELCKRFNWDYKLPIIGIFDHSYTDGLFICGRSIFETNYSWITYTLNEIQNINNVNWLIKAHPEKSYETHKAKTNTKNEFFKIVNQNKNNIKLFPEDLSSASLFNILSAIITGNGTVGLEYSVFGIPTILANHAHYSGFGFTHEPSSLNEYSKHLNNIDKLNKLDKEQTTNARIFVSMELNQSIANLSLLPKFIPNSQIFFKKNYDEFWKQMYDQIIDFDLNKDDFYFELKKQIKNKNSHTLKFNYQN